MRRIWNRWRYSISLGLIALVLFSIGMALTYWEMDRTEDRWEETCAQLDADSFKGPAGWACIRNGEVVYPK